jgi:hypothetical protein
MYSFKPTPGLQPLRLNYRTFFLRKAIRLGDNLFLVRHTNDKKGKSRVETIALIFLTEGDKNGKTEWARADYWRTIATVKRNRFRYNRSAIQLDLATWGLLDGTNVEDVITLNAQMRDTNENHALLVNLMVTGIKALQPNLFTSGPLHYNAVDFYEALYDTNDN